jgi:hypothetical protein
LFEKEGMGGGGSRNEKRKKVKVLSEYRKRGRMEIKRNEG